MKVLNHSLFLEQTIFVAFFLYIHTPFVNICLENLLLYELVKFL